MHADDPLIVAESEVGMRLDRFVVQRLPTISRSRIQALIAAEIVTINGKPAKAGWTLAVGDVVTVPVDAAPPAPAMPAAEQIPLTIVYEDQFLLVIDKPAGMVVHPAPGHRDGTLVNALLGYTDDLGAAAIERPGIVHRLDRDTSGLLLIAKDDAHNTAPGMSRAMVALGQMMRDRTILKEYIALVEGSMDPPAGLIDAPIGRDPRHRQRMAILAQGGRPAQTRYRTTEVIRGRSLLVVQLITGRTHQIRVHCAAVHHPVVGDSVYGRPQAPMPPRQFLHATHLAFNHPITGVPMDIVSPLPSDLQTFLDAWRAGKN